MMGIKQIEKRLGFAELAFSNSMERNRSLQTLKELDRAINWNRIEKTLMKHYHIGISNEGADAYLHDGAKRARFTKIIKNIYPVKSLVFYLTGVVDAMGRQAAFNIKRGAKLLAFT